MSADSKTIRLVTALVECRPDGEYVPWGIRWHDGASIHSKRSNRTLRAPGRWETTMFANLGVWFSKTTLPARSAITKTAGTWSTTRKTTSRASRLQSERQVCSTPFPSWLFSHGDASFPIALRCGTRCHQFQSWRLASKPSGMSHSRYTRT